MPNSSDTLISIILPAYNEEAVIGDVVLGILDLDLERAEVLVVDDGSSDATADVAEAAGATVIRHPYNIGNGAAVKTGIRSASGRVLVFLDADGQHDPKDIPRIVAGLSKYHMVIGARQKDSETSWHRDVANKIYSSFASYVAHFKVEDLTSGFRAMRRIDALRFCDMLPNQFSYPTTSTLAFLRSGRTIKYVPIKTRYRVGKSKIRIMRDGPGFLLIILKIATLFSPLRVFIPASALFMLLALAWYAFTFVTQGRFTNMSALMFTTSVLVFMLGLVAEQIASLRLEKGDKLYNIDEIGKYDLYSDYHSSEVLEQSRPQ